MNFSTYTILQYASRILVLIICLPIHEYAHAKAAYAFGDKTAKYSGRLTLNPLKSLDPIGAISLLVIGVGWAKPVPIDISNFRNKKRDMAIVSLAGPLSNVILAIIGMILSKVIRIISIVNPTYSFFLYASVFLYYFVYINCILAIFNILPIPPLDGSKLLFSILPDKFSEWIYKYEIYFFGALILILFLGVLDYPLDILTQWLLKFINFCTLILDMTYQTLVGGVHV